jgi:hypothetical protein
LIVVWLVGVGIFAALIVLCIVNRWFEQTFAGRFLLYLDIFGCAVFTGNADMTISARCGLYLRTPVPPDQWRALGWCLNYIQKGHCEMAILNDRSRAMTAIGILSLPISTIALKGVPSSGGLTRTDHH